MDDRVAALFRQQAALQREADDVVTDLGLETALAVVGDPRRVGSSAMGLMVRRDIDITVACHHLTLGPVLDLIATLGPHPRVREIVFRNDTGDWNTDPGYPDGLYLGLSCRSAGGLAWTADIWFVDEPERQPDLAHLRTIPPRLTDETRAAILTIKTAWIGNPQYGRDFSSADVYGAVLDGGVRTPEEFADWLTTRPAE